MNFVKDLEDRLRDLASRSRQGPPGVKEACERATLRLRTLQTAYVQALRKDPSHPPSTRLLGHADVVHPFLLATNYPTAPFGLLEVALPALQLLLQHQALPQESVPHVWRVWTIQAHVVYHYYQQQQSKPSIQRQQSSSTSDAPRTAEPVPTTPQPTTSSTSWFSWSSASKPTTDPKPTSSSTTTSTLRTKAPHSPAHMEKLALELLQCVLVWLQHSDQAEADVWKSALALCLLWLPVAKSKIYPAARTTLQQTVGALFGSSNHSLVTATWQDFLRRLQPATKKATDWQGALGQCAKVLSSSSATSTAVAQPPTIELTLDLMQQVWSTSSSWQTNALTEESLQVTMALWQTKLPLDAFGKLVGWTVHLLHTTAASHPTETKEVWQALGRTIPAATDACRQHDDFEDGFVYAKSSSLATSISTTTNGGFPPRALYQAAFVLEATLVLLLDASSELSRLVGLEAAEALSDFATIGASCRPHMEALVQHVDQLADTTVKSPVGLSRQLLEQGSQLEALLVQEEGDSGAKPSSSTSTSTATLPVVLGEALWTAFCGVLQLVERWASDDTTSMTAFAPTLAVLQHYLKRFPGCLALVDLTLQGYTNLAQVVCPGPENHVERKVLLTSLSKLSLPAWGKHDPSGQLEDHHIRSLVCLVKILHVHLDSISSEWEILLWTLQELSLLSIASPLLSEDAYHGALNIAAVFERLPAFSTCLTSESLQQMAQALTAIAKTVMGGRDVVGNSDTVLPDRSTTASALMDEQRRASVDKESISERLVNMGVRAIYGNADADPSKSGSGESLVNALATNRTKNTYYEDYRKDFLQRLAKSKASIRVSAIGPLPFVLTLLADLALSNSFRYQEIGETMSEQLSSLSAASPAVRPFAMDIMTMLTMSHISGEGESPSKFDGPGKLLFPDPMQSQLLAVERIQEPTLMESSSSVSQSNLLGPLCETIRSTEKPEVAEASLGSLISILEGTGHQLSGDVWTLVIDAVASLSGDPKYQKVDRSASTWAKCGLSGFRCTKLIVEDFHDKIASAEDSAKLLECCASFGRALHDINTSLTAVGLLWSIADQNAQSVSVDLALSKLVGLAEDDRPEVRNAAVNTLFSCIIGRGKTFTPAEWNLCIVGRVFAVYDLVSSNIDNSESSARSNGSSRYKVALHHSRDSAGKQWVATQVVVLRGLIRMLRSFFPQFLETVVTENDSGVDTPWFQDAWVRIIDFGYDAAGQTGKRDTLDIRSVGVDLLILCCQLSSRAGLSALNSQARVTTNMEVVNGALRQVRGNATTDRGPILPSYSTAAHVVRKKLFLESFESLESFRELLESMPDVDDVLLQIIHKFAEGLSGIFECCRDHEFQIDEIAVGMAYLVAEDREEQRSEEHLPRFLAIAETLLRIASTQASSRFLNQAQKASLELLEKAAAIGSVVAFRKLVLMAGVAMFLRKDAEKDDHESASATEDFHSYELINFEASVCVSKSISKDTVSSVCRALVLDLVLSKLIAEEETYGFYRYPYYKRLLPVLQEGLGAVQVLLPSDTPAVADHLISIRRKFDQALTIMFSPIPTGNERAKISRTAELLEILQLAKATTHSSEDKRQLSGVLVDGARNALTVAGQDNRVIDKPGSESSKRLRKYHDDLLSLFIACFFAALELHPDNERLPQLADQVLSNAVAPNDETASGDDQATSDTTPDETSKPASSDFGRDVCVLFCRSLTEHEGVEDLVVAVFSNLTQLLVHPELQASALAVIAQVEVAGVLQAARAEARQAQERAGAAEAQITRLQSTIESLQRRNQQLNQEVVALEASAAASL